MIQLNDKDVSHCIGSAMFSKCLWHPILELAGQRETEKAGTKILSKPSERMVFIEGSATIPGRWPSIKYGRHWDNNA